MSFATHGMLESHQPRSHTSTPFFSNVGQVDFRPGIQLQNKNVEYHVPLGPNGESGTLTMKARQIEEPTIQKHEPVTKSKYNKKSLTFDAYIEELAKCHVATFQPAEDAEKNKMKARLNEYVNAGRPDFGAWRNMSAQRQKLNDCTELLAEYESIQKADKKQQKQQTRLQETDAVRSKVSSKDKVMAVVSSTVTTIPDEPTVRKLKRSSPEQLSQGDVNVMNTLMMPSKPVTAERLHAKLAENVAMKLRNRR